MNNLPDKQKARTFRAIKIGVFVLTYLLISVSYWGEYLRDGSFTRDSAITLVVTLVVVTGVLIYATRKYLTIK